MNGLRAGPVNAHELGRDVTLDIMLRVLLGIDDPPRLREVARATIDALDAVRPHWLFVPQLQRAPLGLGSYGAFLRAMGVAEAELGKEFVRARSGETQGLLNELMGPGESDTTSRDRLFTLIAAGHETTAVTLAWTLDFLVHNPAALGRLVREVRTVELDDWEALAELPLLEATVFESMRLRPVLTEVLRTLHEPLEVMGYTVPAGACVAACQALAHTRPKVFPDPEQFLPERFLGTRFSPYEYFPFGGGNRHCIGAVLAMLELKSVLGALLQRFDVEPGTAQPARAVRRNITMAPAGGVEIRLRPRQRSLAKAVPIS